MDSITQFALGAGVTAALLGPRIGARKALILGGVLGTLPDLDVYLPFDDPVDAFTLHRGATHSLFVHLAATPILAELARLIFRGLRDTGRARTYLAVFLALSTHALLDAMTVYGTRIFWPFWPEPVAVGSIFIIDPFYTVPLIVIVLWGLALGGWGPRLRRAVAAVMVVSTAYLGWSLIAQQLAHQRALETLAARGLDGGIERTLSTPLPFNTFLWRTLAVGDDHYLNIYDSLTAPGGAARVHRHPRDIAAIGCLAEAPKFRQLAAFSKGFYTVRRDPAGDILYSDLRMGVTPDFSFTFKIGAVEDGRAVARAPERVLAGGRTRDGDWDWLRAALFGDVGIRPAEALAHIGENAAVTRLVEAPPGRC